MSDKQHPNLNAAALSSDIVASIYTRMRGKASTMKLPESFGEKIVQFVSDVEKDIDEMVKND